MRSFHIFSILFYLFNLYFIINSIYIDNESHIFDSKDLKCEKFSVIENIDEINDNLDHFNNICLLENKHNLNSKEFANFKFKECCNEDALIKSCEKVLKNFCTDQQKSKYQKSCDSLIPKIDTNGCKDKKSISMLKSNKINDNVKVYRWKL